MTKEDIKAICYGRDDLLAVAEKICEESGLDAADGEVLCEELARTCADYLNWVDKPVEEDNECYRTYDDTQIFKQYEGDECEISEKEWYAIIVNAKSKEAYKYYIDKANGYVAFSFSGFSQKENSAWGEDLVNILNEICVNNGTEPCWFLGDINEEYVFVD